MDWCHFTNSHDTLIGYILSLCCCYLTTPLTNQYRHHIGQRLKLWRNIQEWLVDMNFIFDCTYAYITNKCHLELIFIFFYNLVNYQEKNWKGVILYDTWRVQKFKLINSAKDGRLITNVQLCQILISTLSFAFQICNIKTAIKDLDHQRWGHVIYQTNILLLSAEILESLCFISLKWYAVDRSCCFVLVS